MIKEEIRMAYPTREALEAWADGYVALWNSGDKQAWVANWKSVAPGDFIMVDPVGTTPKNDFEGCASKPYDHFQPAMRFRVDPATRFICANEVSWVMENTIEKDGRVEVLLSIETYIFGDDGSVEIRTHYDVPDASNEVAGQLFQEYLPGEA
jgi:hypothetical protein